MGDEGTNCDIEENVDDEGTNYDIEENVDDEEIKFDIEDNMGTTEGLNFNQSEVEGINDEYDYEDQHLQTNDFAPDCYKKKLYEACYAQVIYPVNGEALWIKFDVVDLQPPPIKRQPERPKKKRNGEAGEMVRDETHLKRANYGTKCSLYHKDSHNKATCKLPQPQASSSQVLEGTQPRNHKQQFQVSHRNQQFQVSHYPKRKEKTSKGWEACFKSSLMFVMMFFMPYNGFCNVILVPYNGL
ncbi:hypothetical protein KIW84_015844 [Lathyrus oleraceus]|uniref:Uncharacterized protein n=1 Tax=Pisum sativum TaxID=3888 RepID=A0A9D5BRD0_PEA|nr:hypothetical protein KIW84_015844 [Pisum sativum]